MASVVGQHRPSRSQPKVELNSLTDEILIKIFVYLDFKTRHERLLAQDEVHGVMLAALRFRHNWIPLVCHRWARLVRSNELWHDVLVMPHEESAFCNGTISQSKVFHWCCQPHVRPFVQRLKLVGLGAEHDDFTSVGLGALFGICCSALTKLEIHATRALLSDLSALLCLLHIKELSVTCIDPDPLNPFHAAEVQCVAKLDQLKTLVFDLNLVHVPGDLSQLQKLRSLSVSGTGSTPLSLPFQLSSLCQLQHLVVKKPLWVEVPDVVHHFPRLKSFEIRGHPVFGHNIGFCPAAAKMNQLERLGIIAHMLQRTPEEVGEMIFLKHLDLSWNTFDERLPGDVVFPFKKLCRLETLDISHCGLKHLPASLSYLSSLTRLNLSGNLLDSVSNVLRHCFALKRLIMRGCGLESVPVEISDIENLEHLDISNNPITSVDGLSALLMKARFVSLVFRQEKWNPSLVTTACGMARIWGKRAPIVD